MPLIFAEFAGIQVAKIVFFLVVHMESVIAWFGYLGILHKWLLYLKSFNEQSKRTFEFLYMYWVLINTSISLQLFTDSCLALNQFDLDLAFVSCSINDL